MTVTIKDIAKVLNISHSTVSRALTGSKSVNEKTKDEIFRVAKELHYIPNINARSLRIDKAYNIGVFFSTIDNGTSPFVFHNVISNVYRNMDRKYNVIVKGIDMHEENTISPKNYDGILVLSQKEDDDGFIKEIIKNKMPIVVINRKVKHKVTNVYTDEKIATYKGIDELIKNGHRNIAIIEGRKNFYSTKIRRMGYLEAFKSHNIKLNKNLVFHGDFSVKSGYLKAKEIIDGNEKFSAIFAFNDEMATGAIKAIEEHGLKVPDDISVLGFDGNEIGKFINPSITTIIRPIGEISRIGIELLFKLINNEKDADGKKIYIESELSRGNSIRDLN